METTENDLLGGCLRIIQPASGYRVNSDAVLLAALAPLFANQKVLELGTGYGQVALCLLARQSEIRVTGIELMPDSARLAQENATLNNMGDRFNVVHADMKNYPFAPEYDLVITNPPYRQKGTHTASDDAIKAASTVESMPLAQWIAYAAAALKPEGHFLMIHDMRRQQDALDALRAAGFGHTALLPLLPKPGRDALRMVIYAQKGGTFAQETLPGLLMHEEDGRWCSQIDAVLRAPKPLALWPF